MGVFCASVWRTLMVSTRSGVSTFQTALGLNTLQEEPMCPTQVIKAFPVAAKGSF